MSIAVLWPLIYSCAILMVTYHWRSTVRVMVPGANRDGPTDSTEADADTPTGDASAVDDRFRAPARQVASLLEVADDLPAPDVANLQAAIRDTFRSADKKSVDDAAAAVLEDYLDGSPYTAGDLYRRVTSQVLGNLESSETGKWVSVTATVVTARPGTDADTAQDIVLADQSGTCPCETKVATAPGRLEPGATYELRNIIHQGADEFKPRRLEVNRASTVIEVDADPMLPDTVTVTGVISRVLFPGGVVPVCDEEYCVEPVLAGECPIHETVSTPDYRTQATAILDTFRPPRRQVVALDADAVAAVLERSPVTIREAVAETGAHPSHEALGWRALNKRLVGRSVTTTGYRGVHALHPTAIDLGTDDACRARLPPAGTPPADHPQTPPAPAVPALVDEVADIAVKAAGEPTIHTTATEDTVDDVPPLPRTRNLTPDGGVILPTGARAREVHTVGTVDRTRETAYDVEVEVAGQDTVVPCSLSKNSRRADPDIGDALATGKRVYVMGVPLPDTDSENCRLRVSALAPITDPTATLWEDIITAATVQRVDQWDPQTDEIDRRAVAAGTGDAEKYKNLIESKRYSGTG